MRVKKYAVVLMLLAWAILNARPFGLLGPSRAAEGMIHVLIVNSYHQGFTWTDHIVAGMKDAIGELYPDMESQIHFTIEYLDTQRMSDDVYYEEMYKLYTYKFKDSHFEVILVSDDEAFNFMRDYHDALFPEVPVVFCGVNFFKDADLNGNPLFTGVLEAPDMRATIELALDLHPQTQTALVINDTLRSGVPSGELYQGILPLYEKMIDFKVLENESLESVLEQVEALPPESLIFFTTFYRNEGGDFFPNNQKLEIIYERASAPIYGLWSPYLGHGIMGGMLTHARSQGYAAGQMAARILQGEDVRSMEVVRESPNRYMFDYDELERWNISTDALPPNSILYNEPEPMTRQYYNMLIRGALAVGVLILVIAVLGVANFRRMRAEEALREYQNHLQEIVEDRTVELQIMNGQLMDEITERREVERNLRQSRNTLNSIYRTVPVGICLTDEDAKFVYVNDAYCEIYGYTREEMIGQPFTMVLPPETRIYGQEAHDGFLNGEQELKAEWDVMKKDGSHITISAAAGLLIREDGHRMKVTVVSDITESKRVQEALQASEQKLRSFIEQSSDGIMLTDGFGRVAIWNSSLERITGVPAGQAVGRPLWQVEYEILSPGEKAQTTPEQFKGWSDAFFAESQPARLDEVPIMRPDGTSGYLQCLFFPVKIAGGQIIGAIHRDITRRKQEEEELRQAKEAAEAANRAKSTFLANMSHELRTPLNAVLGFAQLMARDAALNFEQRENLRIITRSGQHLLSLINDVLELSKIEAGRATLQESDFDLHALIDALEDMFYLRAQAKGLSLVVDEGEDLPRYIRADEAKLRQVLTNLLSNAVKFTEEGGVAMRAGCAKAAEGSAVLRFEVEDTGPGIAPEEHEILFDPFIQTETGRESQEGTGLGLPISHEFVSMMGGELGVQSEIGRGSVFKFAVPVQVVDESAVARRSEERIPVGLEAGQPVYRLLAVDDREMSRALLKKLLEPLGFEVREAATGQQAVDVWREWHPHLIWMDMRMPIMNGYDATRAIKATTEGQATVIIALTASAFEEDRAMILSEGCDDFMRKPFRQEDVFEKLKQHLGVRFVYDADDSGGAEVQSGDDALSLEDMPADWIAQFDEAANQADFDRLLTLIDEVGDEKLAGALAEKVNGFDYDTLLSLTRKANVGEE